jgi:hypothetical protein
VLALLVTGALHVFWLRPRLAKVSDQYQTVIPNTVDADTISYSGDEEPGLHKPLLSSAPQMKELEKKVARQTHLLSTLLRWESVLGIAVLVCSGLMSVFAGTLLPASANQTVTQQSTAVKPFHTVVQTTDKQFSLTVTVSPNRFGSNICTVSVLDSKGKPDTQVDVSVYTTSLDMDMGTDVWNLKPDGQGHFSQEIDFDMSGHWQVRVAVRTSQGTLHEATLSVYAPF